MGDLDVVIEGQQKVISAAATPVPSEETTLLRAAISPEESQRCGEQGNL